MKTKTALLAAVAAIGISANGYEATWESLDARPVPAWWTEAKFGWKVADGGLEIELPRFLPGESPVEFAPVFKIAR